MITIEICMGTTCYILGSAHLANISERLPQDIKDQVIVKGMRCIGACQDKTLGSPPFARINGVILSRAHDANIISEVRQLLAQQ